MKTKLTLTIVLVTVLGNCLLAPLTVLHAATVGNLRCEYLENPLGIDTAKPRFTWEIQVQSSKGTEAQNKSGESKETTPSSKSTVTSDIPRGVKQTAYQILVASSEALLKKDRGDKWDTGKVDSDQSVNVVYQGKALASCEKCWWKVRVWGKDGEASGFSEPASFEMGLLQQSDWQGRWIEADRHISAPLFRREFGIPGEMKRARAYISGLGWNELYINGKKVSDHVLDPATTYYNNDQPFELGSRILYVTHDVTDYLRKGNNTIGVMLGNGWYSNDEAVLGKDVTGRQSFGARPILRLQMNVEYTDGRVESIVTDDKWKVSDGPITANEICLGEAYDARLEKTGWDSPRYDDSEWNNAVGAKIPGGKMVSQVMPPVKVMKTMKPVKITQPAEGVYIYDFGQHFSGWTRLRVEGPRGTKVTIRHAGMLHADGRINTMNLRQATQTDTYILKGEGIEEWAPRFTLHGFRYAEVTGFPGTPALTNLEASLAYNAVETSGSFECSNALLNQIHSNVCWTFMSSLQGIPQDAAERNERLAWMGDTGFVLEDYLYNYNTVLFWTKWLDDIKDSQKHDGDIPVVSPLYWRKMYLMWPCFKSTYPLVAWYLYQHYGDERVLADHYEGIARLVEFLSAQADNHIITRGLGDHMEPDRAAGYSNFRPQRTPAAITSTGFYYFDVWILAQSARILGKTEDYKRYSALADNIKKAFNGKFLNQETNQYATGSQTANAMSLHLGLVPKEKQVAVLKNLVDDIMVKNEGHLSTGILGTSSLEQVLGELGRADVMYGFATKTTYPSWGFTISKGATTVWESFELDSQKPYLVSHNMKMFGSTEKFFYKDLAGIGLGDVGFKQIRIRPCIVGDLTYARASLKTVRGLIAVDWKRANQSVEMKVSLPPNS
ncbi:MAG: family 78 glycoside hydrolase catalytic domain, partial [Deltaproteobacteria bacterium]|nr:family 78 glycoside hydrolase catalytic domain [Deltaproteobacteria bacterium]